MGEQFERFARIAYFSKSSNIIESNAQEIADLLGLQEAGRLNFNYPDKIATLFQTKLETQEYEQSM